MTHEMNDCNNRRIYWWKRFTFAYRLQCMTDVPFQLSRIFAIFLNFLQFFLYAFVMICFSFPSFIQFLCSFFFADSSFLYTITQLHTYTHTHRYTEKWWIFSIKNEVYLLEFFIHSFENCNLFIYQIQIYIHLLIICLRCICVCVCMYLQHKKKFNLQILQEIIIMFVNRFDLMVSEWSSNLFMMGNIVIFYQAFAKFVDSTFETKNLFIYLPNKHFYTFFKWKLFDTLENLSILLLFFNIIWITNILWKGVEWQ